MSTGTKTKNVKHTERLKQLAQPKYVLSLGNIYGQDRYHRQPKGFAWGNQSMMLEIGKSTLNATPSARTVQLAKHKKQHGSNQRNRPEYEYSCGRHSPILQVKPAALRPPRSHSRLDVISLPKPCFASPLRDIRRYVFSCGRASPIVTVPPMALSAPSRPCLAVLSQPKKLHNKYLESRPLGISPTAFKAAISPRSEMLALPKNRSEAQIRDSIWKVSRASLRAVASERVAKLSDPKKVPDAYMPSIDQGWGVDAAVLRYTASERVNQLAQPIVRATMDLVQFNSEAFLVSRRALKASCTPRLEELSEPTLRGAK